MQGATCGSLDTEATQSTVDPRAAGDELGAEMEPPPCGDRGSDNRGYVNRDPSQQVPVRGWGYFLAAFFLRSAQ